MYDEEELMLTGVTELFAARRVACEVAFAIAAESALLISELVWLSESFADAPSIDMPFIEATEPSIELTFDSEVVTMNSSVAEYVLEFVILESE
jgi:hypothetical protein